MSGVLITGGAGFVGSHVVERFLRQGFEVHVLDNLVSGSRSNVPSDAVFHEFDVRDRSTRELIADLQPIAVVHLAATADASRSCSFPLADAENNLIGTIAVLEAIRLTAPRARFVFASTAGLVANGPRTQILSAYAVGKQAAEHYVDYYSTAHGLDTVVLRLGNAYGPRQTGYDSAGVVSVFCRRLLDDSPLVVHGDGRQTRDFICVSDVADAIWLASTRQTSGEKLPTLSIGSGVATSVLELAELLSVIAGKTPTLTFAPVRQADPRDSRLDSTVAQRMLGWTPQVELVEGLSSTYEWFALQQPTLNSSLESAAAP
jgi:UDP-glucose 4-epimerase